MTNAKRKGDQRYGVVHADRAETRRNHHHIQGGRGGATASVPVQVRERNLIAYGPAVQHGLTFTIDPDGGLHVTGSIAGWLMVQWQMDPTGLAGQTLTLTLERVTT